MLEVTVYTDGACKGNPGPGGWAAIVSCRGHERVISGGAEDTTNNKMELRAVIEAIKFCSKAPAKLVVHTDSTYVMMDAEKWKKWMAKPNLPNKDLWLELMDAIKAGKHKISFVHVDGHAGNEPNERCDKLAKEKAAEYAAKVGWKPKSCRQEIEELMQEELLETIAKLERRREFRGQQRKAFKESA